MEVVRLSLLLLLYINIIFKNLILLLIRPCKGYLKVSLSYLIACEFSIHERGQEKGDISECFENNDRASRIDVKKSIYDEGGV